MKNLTQFLQHLKDEVLSPHSEIEIFSFPDTGEFEIRLLARRGDVTVLPHHKARIHFVSFRENARKDAIRCLGRNCPLCELVNTDFDRHRMMAATQKAFFYALRNEKVVIFSCPPSFLTALYGEVGSPSEVTKLALEGMSIFDLDQGHSISVKRENTDTTAFWMIRVNPNTSSLTQVQKEDLLVAPRLSDTYCVLNQDEMGLLCRFLEGRTTDLPSKLRPKKRR